MKQLQIQQLPALRGRSLQTKLQVNRPGDRYEQEADAMADRVVRMGQEAGGNGVGASVSLIGPSLQRKCAHCEEEEKNKKLMRKETGSLSSGVVPTNVQSGIASGKASGQPLAQQERTRMEAAFGTDFSAVRIHTDASAAAMNMALEARAFTTGQDIFFDRGEYNPASAEGTRLLAHELTHTLQQGSGDAAPLMRDRRGSGGATSRASVIAEARRRAFHRVSVAYLRINGTSPHFNLYEELNTVRGLIAPDIVNFDQIVEIVSSILMRLSSDDNIVTGPEIRECTGAMGWNAYVSGNRLPIHLCERFFRMSQEQQVRTLIHEAAHAAGIGEPNGESYFPVFDCSPSTQDNWSVADAWARYIHCISGQTPDQP